MDAYTGGLMSDASRLVYHRRLDGQESFFDKSHEKGQFFPSVVLLKCKLELTEKHMYKALDMVRQRHTSLRACIVAVEDGDDIIKYFQDMPNGEALDLETVSEGVDDWGKVISRELKTPPNSSQGPLWRCKLLQGYWEDVQKSETRFYKTGFVLTAHHAIMDGRSLWIFSSQVINNLNKIIDGENKDVFESLPFPPVYEDLISEPCESKLDAVNTTVSQVKEASQKQSPNEYSVNSNTTIETQICPFIIDKDLTSRLVQKAKEHGIAVTGVLTAAAAVALTSVLQDDAVDVVRFTVMTSLRRHFKGKWTDEFIANYISFLMISAKITSESTGPQGFWEIARGIHEDIHSNLRTREDLRVRKKPSKNWPALEIRKTSSTALESKSFEESSQKSLDTNMTTNDALAFIISNIGQQECTQGSVVNIDSCYSTTARPINAPFNHNLVTFNGKMFWSLAYCTDMVPSDIVKKYAKEIQTILGTVC
ncbi:uncharacterized protein LOC144435838 [Glandiceps talaboti]